MSQQRAADLARLRGVRDRIDREYAQPLDVEALARGAHMSAGHLSRQFRLAYGESPYGYLMTRRIERAMALLRRGDLSVTEVCFAVFWRDTIGFEVRNDIGEGNLRWITVGPADQPGTDGVGEGVQEVGFGQVDPDRPVLNVVVAGEFVADVLQNGQSSGGEDQVDAVGRQLGGDRAADA